MWELLIGKSRLPTITIHLRVKVFLRNYIMQWQLSMPLLFQSQIVPICYIVLDVVRIC